MTSKIEGETTSFRKKFQEVFNEWLIGVGVPAHAVKKHKVVLGLRMVLKEIDKEALTIEGAMAA